MTFEQVAKKYKLNLDQKPNGAFLSWFTQVAFEIFHDLNDQIPREPVAEYTIEKNIPIPPFKQNKDRTHGFTQFLLKLSVGDSFVCPASEKHSFQVCSGHKGIKITTRKISRVNIRIWRIK